MCVAWRVGIALLSRRWLLVMAHTSWLVPHQALKALAGASGMCSTDSIHCCMSSSPPMSPKIVPASGPHHSLRVAVAFRSLSSVTTTVYLFAHDDVASAQTMQKARPDNSPGDCYRLWPSPDFAPVSGAVPDAPVPVGVAVQHVLRGHPSERRHGRREGHGPGRSASWFAVYRVLLAPLWKITGAVRSVWEYRGLVR